MWLPILATDALSAARRSSGYLTDPRVTHYWDLWSFTSKSFAKALAWAPDKGPVWDIFLLYDGDARWTYAAPIPRVWMQNLGGAELGPPYEQARLEAALKLLK